MPTSATTTQAGLAPEASPANLYDLVAGAVRTSPHRVAGDRRKLAAHFNSS